jgi:threonine/homoserine/homoserine lactone efflux protein
MSYITISGLALAMLILALTPGPGVFATVASSLTSGFKNTLGLILGIVLGDTIFLMFSIFGLSIIAETMGTLFIAIKYCGSLYLLWLGIKMFTSKGNYSESSTLKRGNFFTGLFITLSNPKVILFYCGFLPTFVDIPKLTNMDILIITIIITSVLASVLVFYAYLADTTRSLMKNRKSIGRLNKVAGSIMISSAFAIATKS